MKKKLFALFLGLCMILGLFSGCGGTAASAQSTPDSTPAETSAPAEAPDQAASAPAQEADSAEPAAPADSAQETEPTLPGPSQISYPVADGDTYTISVVADGNLLDSIPDSDPANCYGIAQMCEATGIQLDYTVFAMLSDNMTLMISSGDWTDIICKIDENYSAGIQGALDEEVIMDLAPYIDEYAPNYAAYVHSDPMFEKLTYTDAGQMGAFYHFQQPNIAGWAIRKDWLDEAGIENVPETYDELENACLAILDKHPMDAAIPMAPSFIAQGYESEIMYGYGLDTMNNEFFRGEDGKITYAWTTDNARSYIEMVARWAQEGIFNVDQMLTGDIATLGSNLYVGTAVAKHNGVEMFGDDQLALADDPNFEIVPMNEPTVNKGDTLRFGGSEMRVSVAWSVTTTCPNPEQLIQAINWIYTDEGTVAMNFGREGDSYTIDENGNYHYTDLVLNNPDGIPMFLAASIATGLEAPKIEMPEMVDAKLSNQLQLDAKAFYASQDRTTDGVRRGTLTSEETAIVGRYADIETVVQEQMMAFATGATPINDETWGAFCDQVNSMGIDEIVAAYQSAQDRYDAK